MAIRRLLLVAYARDTNQSVHEKIPTIHSTRSRRQYPINTGTLSLDIIAICRHYLKISNHQGLYIKCPDESNKRELICNDRRSTTAPREIETPTSGRTVKNWTAAPTVLIPDHSGQCVKQSLSW